MGTEPGAFGVVTGGLNTSRIAMPNPTSGSRKGAAAMAMAPTFSRIEGSACSASAAPPPGGPVIPAARAAGLLLMNTLCDPLSIFP
ncbi:hypothetical protein D3C81_1999010 [compost metagenome]